MSRHLFSESQLFVDNILCKVAHTNLSIASFLSHFWKKYSIACPIPVDVDKKVPFNHSILCCGRTLTNHSSKTAMKPLVVVKRHKSVLEFRSFLKDEVLHLSSKDVTCGFRRIKFGLFLPNTFVWLFSVWFLKKFWILNSSWTLKFLELDTLFILSLWKKTNSHGSCVPSPISFSQWNGRRLT